MRGISEAGSGSYCLVSQQSVVNKKETEAAYCFFQQSYYLQSETEWLYYIDLAKAKNEAFIPPPAPPPPPSPHHSPLRSY